MSYLRGIEASWPVVAFGELVTGADYGLSRPSVPDGNVAILKMNSLKDGKINLDDLDRVTCSNHERHKYFVRRGDILFNRTNSFDLVGKTAVVDEDYDVVFASYLVRFKIHNKADPRFIGYWFNSDRAQKRMKELATPGVSQSNINPSRLQRDLRLPLPPLPEQRKIADILTTWDEALEKLDALIAAKERRKQGLMQQLLTGRRRLKGFKDKWKTQELGAVITANSRPVPKPAEPFLAAGIRSHGRGVFLKPDFNPGDIALDELFQLRANDLVVNITFAWEGALAIVPPDADGALVSHRFPVFQCEKGKSALGFIRHIIRTKRFVFECGLASPGGAGRNRVLSKDAFLSIAVSLPSFAEQTAIAAILDTCDEELRLLRAQRAAHDQQKRGLMQCLLTGKVRVK